MWHGRVIHVTWACQSREPRHLKWPFPLVPVNWRLPEESVDRRIKRGKPFFLYLATHMQGYVYYLVLWKGYRKEDATWVRSEVQHKIFAGCIFREFIIRWISRKKNSRIGYAQEAMPLINMKPAPPSAYRQHPDWFLMALTRVFEFASCVRGHQEGTLAESGPMGLGRSFFLLNYFRRALLTRAGCGFY